MDRSDRFVSPGEYLRITPPKREVDAEGGRSTPRPDWPTGRRRYPAMTSALGAIPYSRVSGRKQEYDGTSLDRRRRLTWP